MAKKKKPELKVVEVSHSRWSPSASDRWSHCPGSVTLTSGIPPKPPGDASMEGSCAHELAALCLNEGTWANDHLGETFKSEDWMWTVDEEMVDHVNDYLEYVWDQAEEHGAEIHVEVKVHATKIAQDCYGTADVILTAPMFLQVIDLKYGRGKLVEVEGNTQLGIYGIGALEKHKIPKSVRPRLTIYQPRIPHPHGAARSWNVTQSRLAAMQKGLSNAIANAVSGDPFYFTGDHCTWCPGAGVCKKLAEENMLSAKQVFSPVEEEVKRATDLDRPLLPDPNSMSPNELAAVLQRAPLFTSWLKAVDEKAQELFREGRKFKGMKAVLPMSRRVITDQEKLATALKKAGAKAKDIWADPKLKPLGHLERLDDKAYADIVNAHCHKPEKQPILVSELDPREAIPSVREVFSAIEEEKPKAKKTKRPKSKDAGGLLD